MRVLVVDNDPEILECLTWWLARAGIDVRSYLSLGGPLPVAAGWSPTVIACDFEMPSICGEGALAHVAKRHPGVPLVAMAAGHDSDPSALAALGVRELLAKPFRCEDLLSALRRADAGALSPRSVDAPAYPDEAALAN